MEVVFGDFYHENIGSKDFPNYGKSRRLFECLGWNKVSLLTFAKENIISGARCPPHATKDGPMAASAGVTNAWLRPEPQKYLKFCPS